MCTGWNTAVEATNVPQSTKRVKSQLKPRISRKNQLDTRNDPIKTHQELAKCTKTDRFVFH